MPNTIFQINPKSEKQKIIKFLKITFEKQKVQNAVIGLSGGIDSSVSFFLLKEILPPKNIFVTHMYYDKPVFEHVEKSVIEARIPKENIYLLSIKKMVDETTKLLNISNARDTSDTLSQARRGNIAARMRMIILFDLAKKYNALVCGTENKSENLLGYFTRFGDQASDIEPIEHLYKTQIFQLAKYLGVPEAIINQKPTAGLWAGQTDEGEMGFTYEEADQVLYWYFDKNLPLDKIKTKGLPNAEKIIQRAKANHFKHETPYTI